MVKVPGIVGFSTRSIHEVVPAELLWASRTKLPCRESRCHQLVPCEILETGEPDGHLSIYAQRPRRVRQPVGPAYFSKGAAAAPIVSTPPLTQITHAHSKP